LGGIGVASIEVPAVLFVLQFLNHLGVLKPQQE
jgi:hypothetical protein